jgi:hypothetical protein
MATGDWPVELMQASAASRSPVSGTKYVTTDDTIRIIGGCFMSHFYPI